MKIYQAAAVVAITAACSAAVLASPKNFEQMPQGFDQAAPLTVGEVMDQARDNQLVVMQGRLTGYLGWDRYEFTDAQGRTIEVELDDDYDWSHIRRDQLINITGKVDRKLTHTLIHVKNALAAE